METMNSVVPQEAKGIDKLVLTSAICLSLFGWKYEHNYGIDELRCDMCFRSCSVSGFRNVAKQKEIGLMQENNRFEQEDLSLEVLACKNADEIWDLLRSNCDQF